MWGPPLGMVAAVFLKRACVIGCPSFPNQKTQPEEVPNAVPRSCLFLLNNRREIWFKINHLSVVSKFPMKHFSGEASSWAIFFFQLQKLNLLILK